MLTAALCLLLLSMASSLLGPPTRQRVQKVHSLRPLYLSSSEDEPKFSAAIGVGGVVSNVISDYSLYVLKTTGCGLPPGPFGLEGAAEGISYLVVTAIVAWSAYTKVK